MRLPLRVRLSPGQVAALKRHYRRTPKPAERTRAHIILLSHQGYIPPAIATIVRVDPATVRRAIHRFERHGLRGLLNAPRPGRPRKALVRRSRTRVRKAVVVLDNARFHRPDKSREVAALLQRHGPWLQLVYLPAYSPELQPLDHLFRRGTS